MPVAGTKLDQRKCDPKYMTLAPVETANAVTAGGKWVPPLNSPWFVIRLRNIWWMEKATVVGILGCYTQIWWLRIDNDPWDTIDSGISHTL